MSVEITDVADSISHLRSPLLTPATQDAQREMSCRARDILKAKGILGFMAVDRGGLRPEFDVGSSNNAVTVNATPLVRIGAESVGLRMRPIEGRAVIDVIAIGDIHAEDRETYPALNPSHHIIPVAFNPSGHKRGSSVKEYMKIPTNRGEILSLHLEAAGLLLDAIDEKLDGTVLNLGGDNTLNFPHATAGEQLERDRHIVTLGF